MSDEALRAVIAQDAARIGELLQDGGAPREVRQRARAVLWRAWSVLAPVEDTPERAPADDPSATEESATPDEPGMSAAELLALALELQTIRRGLGDADGAGARPLWQVRIRQPMPDRVRLPISVRGTDRLARTVEDHFQARVALDPERLAWFEQRCGDQAPIRLATVRQPTETDHGRVTDEHELLVRKGRSKFS